MMRWLVAGSMRARTVVAALAAVLVLLGLLRAREMPLDVFPEFAPPLVEIQCEAPGLTSVEVESLVTRPIELGLNGLPWVATIRSKSVLGLASVVLILDEGVDRLQARQLVGERLAVIAEKLPDVAAAPVILPPLSSTSRVMKIGVTSQTLSQVELSTLARWTVRPRLMAVPGVANVAIWGQRDRQLQVLVDPERLAARGVTLEQVLRAAGDAAAVTTGGFIDTPNQRIPVRHATHLTSAEDLERSIVAFEGGVPLRLGDVAEVVEGSPAPIGNAVINDGPGLLLIVEMQPWGNTLDVTRGVDAALAALAPGLQGVDIDPTIFRPATFIETALENLRRALLVGCGLVVVVLIVFLYEWRTALVSVVALPVSLIVAALLLAWRGQTLNTMVLAGLVIALGEVVDDAIIDVENIMRRLRQNAQAGGPRSAFAVVLDASLEVRSAVVFGSFVVVLVLVPVFALQGLAGAFFRPLALAYVLAILASLLVALTLTPALCLWLLPRASAQSRESPVVRRLKRAYGRVLPRLAQRPKLAVLVILASLGGAAIAAAQLGEELLPNFRERDFLMHWVEPPGTSLEAMTRITQRASRELRSIPGVRNFGAHIGRAEEADEVVGPNFTELWISLDPSADYQDTVHRIQGVVDGYPGLYRDLLTYLRERIKEVLTGASASVVVRIYGPELDVLRSKAAEVAASIDGVAGVTDLKVEAQQLVPQLEIRIRPEDAARLGLAAADVRRQVTTLVRGAKVGEVSAGPAVLEVAVWGVPAVRSDPLALRELRLAAPDGAQVRLGDVCDVAIVPTPNEIKREGTSRRIDVTCNVSDRDLGQVARSIEARLASVPFAAGYHPEVLGEYAARESSRRRLGWTSAIALVGILVLLQTEFASWRLSFLVCLTLPFALIGGVAGAWLGGGVLSLGSLIGFVTVLGIAARNAILMISHLRHIEREEGEPFGLALVLRGAEERLSPVLMTALSAGLALVPLILTGNRPGQEIEYPLAVVIVGGLFTSTALCLLLLPGLYLRFARPAAQTLNE
jgi:CzcA family heavy metal efflux pump